MRDQSFIDALNDVNVKLLSNRKVDVAGMDITGVDYSISEDRNSFPNVLSSIGTSSNKYSILLKHSPSNLDITEDAGYDLQLSGHTHRAQVFPFSLIAKAIYKGYDYGLKDYTGILGNKAAGDIKLKVMTSSGAGTWGPPFRFMTNSEIVVLNIKK
jgi:predicted MPP superfamily phosphohydrolase